MPSDEERAMVALGFVHYADLSELGTRDRVNYGRVVALLAEVRREERERCLAIVDTEPEAPDAPFDHEWRRPVQAAIRVTKRNIASRIRALPAPPPSREGESR
jgi:hypothetical protein